MLFSALLQVFAVLKHGDFVLDGEEPPEGLIFRKDHRINARIAKDLGLSKSQIGNWASHLPQMSLRGKRESDHWSLHVSVRLQWAPEHHVSIYVKDQSGAVVGGVLCDSPTACVDDEDDKLQSFDIQVPDGIKELTPYARFKKQPVDHTWKGTTFPIPPKHREL